jgi:hypothetical protein
MIRNALLLCAALLAAATFACVQMQPVNYSKSLALAGPGVQVAGSPDCSSAANFVGSIQILDASFTPDPTGTSSPLNSALGPITNPAAISDLTKMFNFAPKVLTDQLCSQVNGQPWLNGLFVQNCPSDSLPCPLGSWGYRNKSTKERYIAFSAGLWQNGAAQPYHLFETGVLNQLLGTNAADYTTAGYDGSEMTVLAVLAHEMGHILWWEKQIRTQQCLNPPANPSPPPANLPAKFTDFSWKTAAATPNFHKFGIQNNGVGGFGGDKRKSNVPSKDDVVASIGQPVNALNELAAIYSGEYASLFATVSPDEDFIETYKMCILNSAQPTSSGSGPLSYLIADIPFHGNIDMVNDRFLNQNTLLFLKAAWINTCLSQM